MWFPGAWKLLRWRIDSNWRKGRHRQNEHLAERYVQWRPEDTYGWWVWANVLAQQGKHAQAADVLVKGLSSHPKDPELGWLLARTLIAQSKLSEARALLKEQLNAHPESRLPYLGLLHVAIEEKNSRDAGRWSAEALRRTAPDDAGAKYELGMHLAGVPGTEEQAIKLLQEAALGLPHHSLTHALLGVLLERQGDSAANLHLETARRYWRSPGDFDDFLERTRRRYGSPQVGC